MATTMNSTMTLASAIAIIIAMAAAAAGAAARKTKKQPRKARNGGIEKIGDQALFFVQFNFHTIFYSIAEELYRNQT